MGHYARPSQLPIVSLLRPACPMMKRSPRGSRGQTGAPLRTGRWDLAETVRTTIRIISILPVVWQEFLIPGVLVVPVATMAHISVRTTLDTMQDVMWSVLALYLTAGWGSHPLYLLDAEGGSRERVRLTRSWWPHGICVTDLETSGTTRRSRNSR